MKQALKAKHILTASALLLLSLLPGALPASAQQNAKYHLSGITIDREHGLLKVAMTVNPKDYHLGYNRQLDVTPVIRSRETADSLLMPSFSIAGRNAYYNSERAGEETSLLRAGHGEPFLYEYQTEWQPWMDYSRIDLLAEQTGCCKSPAGPDDLAPVALLDWRPVEFNSMPLNSLFHYEVPEPEEVKTRKIEGKAYVNFPVNRTEIYPDYMVNPQELRKITGSIDTVRNNPDATVRSITLTGYASPEGPYLNNVRLAKGRTEAVLEYVRSQYTFPASIFHAGSVPEDWEGLRDSVATGILPDRAQILDFIDNGGVPVEKRNDELRRRFPVSYEYLLKNIYPSLRHTNYVIDFELRKFANIDEILKTFRERPQNLSLNEFFLAAKTFPVGSKEYDEVINTAVLYYPNDDVANLNAANAAMNEGDYRRARMLLARVGDSASASYARAMLDALEKKYDAAKAGFEKAAAEGIGEAAGAEKRLDEVMARRVHVTFLE